MTIPVFTAKFAGGVNGGSTAAFDSTGATVIFVAASKSTSVGATTVTDNKGNTYTVWYAFGGIGSEIEFWKCESPVVGAGHIITSALASAFTSFVVAGFNNLTLPLVADQYQQNSANSGSTLFSNSITPVFPNSKDVVILTWTTSSSGGAPTLPSSTPSGWATIDAVQYQAGVAYGSGMAFVQETSRVAASATIDFVNPPANYNHCMIFNFHVAVPPLLTQGFVIG